ncbi:hypothetical protein, partial [Escherichia coli]|uniref:hypothetical protein n=1 Tax=Escherichia coli TaxID=562 RepID=UPI001BC8485D
SIRRQSQMFIIVLCGRGHFFGRACDCVVLLSLDMFVTHSLRYGLGAEVDFVILITGWRLGEGTLIGFVRS